MNTRDNTKKPHKIIASATIKTLNDASMLYLADCQARNLSKCTLNLNKIILKHFCDSLEDFTLPEIASRHITEYLSAKATATSASTAARYYTCIRTFFGFMLDHEYIAVNPIQNVKKPKHSSPVIQPLSQLEVEAMIAATSGGKFADMRDKLVIMILVDCGLRASELTALDINDVDFEYQCFTIRHGKGDKSRRVPFGNAVASLLRQYLARRSGVECPNLITTCFGLGTGRYRISRIVEAVATAAKVKRDHIGAHVLRHTFAVFYLRAGGDVFSLQRILGHSSLEMSRHYAELADTDVMDKHKQFSPGDRLTLPVQNGGKRKIQ